MIMISVVMPSKDRRDYLEKTLPTYLAQKEVGEIIVIIDGSTDGTLEYLNNIKKEEKRLRYIDNAINKGIPYSKNIGIANAKYDHIFIAEDDVELTENFFSTLLQHMKVIGADIICGRNIFRYDYESADEAINRTNLENGDYINKRMIEISTSMNIGNDVLTTMSAAPVLGKTEIFQQIQFDERYKVNFWREETDFQFSIQEHGYKLGACSHAVCYNYVIKDDKGGVHSSSGLTRAKWILINNWVFINKHETFIKENFLVKSKYMYILKFTIRMGYLFLKRIILGTVRSS